MEKIVVELWCDESGRQALVREAYRSCVSGGIETLAAAVINALAAKLSSADTADRKAGFDALRLLGVEADRKAGFDA